MVVTASAFSHPLHPDQYVLAQLGRKELEPQALQMGGKGRGNPGQYPTRKNCLGKATRSKLLISLNYRTAHYGPGEVEVIPFHFGTRYRHSRVQPQGFQKEPQDPLHSPYGILTL